MLGNTNVRPGFWQLHTAPVSAFVADAIHTELETHPAQTGEVGNSNPVNGV